MSVITIRDGKIFGLAAIPDGTPVRKVGSHMIGHDSWAPDLRAAEAGDYFDGRIVPNPYIDDAAGRPMPEYGQYHGIGKGGMDRRAYLIARDEHLVFGGLARLGGIWIQLDYWGTVSWSSGEVRGHKLFHLDCPSPEPRTGERS